jgi:hypothetical protein
VACNEWLVVEALQSPYHVLRKIFFKPVISSYTSNLDRLEVAASDSQ